MIYEKLQMVQSKMKAPKNLYNSFGKYKYRNAESILEAFKPFGKELGLVLLLNDTVEQVGERVYIKATATLIDLEEKTILNKVEVSAYAREPVSKKGMDDSQVSGATSSYARKYALNGLFLLDDTKDADTDEYRNQADNQYKAQQETKTRPKKVNENQIQTLCNLIDKKGKTLEEMLALVDVKDVRDLTAETYNRIVLALKDA